MGGLTTWSRFKHSHRIATSASRLTLSHHRYPTFSPSGILLPLLPHASPPPPHTLRDTLSSVVCQDTPAIVSIDAYATRLYARANLPCADRQLSINGGIPHGIQRNVAPKTRAFGKMTASHPTIPPNRVYFNISLPPLFFLLLLCRFSDRAKYFTIFWLSNTPDRCKKSSLYRAILWEDCLVIFRH